MISLPALGLVLVAWLAAATCVALSAWHVRRLARFVPPSRAEVSARFAKLSSESERWEAVQALRDEQTDAERGLSLATLWPRSMARVSLASGTALAVTSLAQGLEASALRLPGGMLEFVAGFVGMMMCAAFGRQAKAATAKLRQGWRDAMRAVARE